MSTTCNMPVIVSGLKFVKYECLLLINNVNVHITYNVLHAENRHNDRLLCALLLNITWAAQSLV